MLYGIKEDMGFRDATSQRITGEYDSGNGEGEAVIRITGYDERSEEKKGEGEEEEGREEERGK